MRGHELGDLVHFVGVPVLLQRLEVVAGSFQEALFVEPGRRIDNRTDCSSRCCRTTENRRLGRFLEGFTLERRVTGGGHLWLLLAATSGNEAEHQEGDQRHDQDVEDLHAIEAIAHEHRGQQATGGDTGQRAEPFRCAAGGCRCATWNGWRGTRGGRGSLAGLVHWRGA
ncbi:hypothetical protein D9M73_207410 [compost metagenome]